MSASLPRVGYFYSDDKCTDGNHGNTEKKNVLNYHKIKNIRKMLRKKRKKMRRDGEKKMKN